MNNDANFKNINTPMKQGENANSSQEYEKFGK